jgi:hypothetical protein
MPVSPIEHPLYDTWKSMLGRCTNPKRPDYPRYGGRGIGMHAEWIGGFAEFMVCASYIGRTLGHRPSKSHQLDRRDNARGYEPGNLRWATRIEQVRNRRTTKFLVFSGERRSVPEWAELVGLRQDALYHRIDAGWTVEDALTTPKGGKRRAA